MTDQLTSLLRAADPVPDDAPLWADRDLDARAERELQELVGGVPVWPRRARWAAAAAGVAALAVLTVTVGVPGLGGSSAPAHAATPPLLELARPEGGPAGPRLEAIAAATDRSAPVVSERGAAWESWSLSTVVDGDDVTSAVLPQEHRLDWTAGGQASLEVRLGEPYFPSQAHREAWQDADVDVRVGEVLHVEDQAAFVPMFPQEPPTDAASMRGYLARSHPEAVRDSAELLVAVGDLAREWQLGPQARTALLQVLADAPGVTWLGATTDRLGRAGEAFAVESARSGLPTRYVVVVDASDGRLLASEEWLTTDAGALDVPVPSVVSYTAWR